MRESANTFTKECFEKMFEHFISIVKTRFRWFYQMLWFIFIFVRHIELEAELKREEKVRTLKKNLKLLMIALIVLAIEKLSEFLTALFSGQASGNTVKTKRQAWFYDVFYNFSNFRNKVNAFAIYLDQGKSNPIDRKLQKPTSVSHSGRSELLREYSLETGWLLLY